MKTKLSSVSATNWQIFNLNKLIQLILFFLLILTCNLANANSSIKPAQVPVNMSASTAGMEYDGRLSNAYNTLVSTSLSWTKEVGTVGTFNTNSYTQGKGISADNSGNIYVTGNTTVGISGQKQNGYYDYYIAKYDVNGRLKWTRQVGTPYVSVYNYTYTFGQGISADSSGNIYVTGYTNVGISGQSQNGLYDYFIAKYDGTGNLKWTKQVGATGGKTYGYGISADHSGNVYVTGYTDRGISGQTQNGSQDDYFIAKYDANGNLIWTRQVGASGGITRGYGISTDGYDVAHIYITGDTNVGISGQIQNGIDDYFIAKYDVNGNLIWTKQVGGTDGVIPITGTQGYGISADSYGNVYVTGETNVRLSGLKQHGHDDYFIAKYDVNGNSIWTKQVGAYQGYTSGQGISADNSGNIYVTGLTYVGISGQKQNGYSDYFVAKYDVNGNLLWTTQVGSPDGYRGGYTEGTGIRADNSGNVYVTGWTDEGISGQTQKGFYDYFIAKYIN